jgi:glucokinase
VLAGRAEDATPSHVDDAAADGDAWALGLWSELAPLLAVALGNAITVLNPSRVILGGGLLSRTPVLRELTLTAMQAVCPAALLEPVTIVEGALGDDAGIIGAALLASRGVSIHA